MPVTIDAAASAPTANAYATVDEADAYINEIYGGEIWLELTADDRARLLIEAAKKIDRLPVAYPKFDAAQKRKFPVAITDMDIADDGFAQAKEASIIQAFYLCRNHESILTAQDEAILGIKSQNLGGVSESKAASGFNPFTRYDGEVLSLLLPYCSFTFQTRRG